jgi:hypothetical protein
MTRALSPAAPLPQGIFSQSFQFDFAGLVAQTPHVKSDAEACFAAALRVVGNVPKIEMREDMSEQAVD